MIMTSQYPRILCPELLGSQQHFTSSNKYSVPHSFSLFPQPSTSYEAHVNDFIHILFLCLQSTWIFSSADAIGSMYSFSCSNTRQLLLASLILYVVSLLTAHLQFYESNFMHSTDAQKRPIAHVPIAHDCSPVVKTVYLKIPAGPFEMRVPRGYSGIQTATLLFSSHLSSHSCECVCGFFQVKSSIAYCVYPLVYMPRKRGPLTTLRCWFFSLWKVKCNTLWMAFHFHTHGVCVCFSVAFLFVAMQ